jgi:hypothetical protein
MDKYHAGGSEGKRGPFLFPPNEREYPICQCESFAAAAIEAEKLNVMRDGQIVAAANAERIIFLLERIAGYLAKLEGDDE